MSTAPPKLTKKQQKAVKHRDKSARAAGKQRAQEATAGDVPEEDLGDEDAAETPKKQTASKKRKRSSNDDEEAQDGDAIDEGAKENGPNAKETAKKPKKKAKDRKPRFIVFVGNLPYKVTTEDIVSHFAETCGESPSVRLLTPKRPTPAPTEAALAKSKGCAFVEFTTSTALQAALHLHQSLFTASATKAKRKINVELTAGGGGNSEARKEKLSLVKERLEKQRENHKTIQDEEKAKKEEEKKKVREEWKKQNQAAGNDPDGHMVKKQKKNSKPPRWLTGPNATKIG